MSQCLRQHFSLSQTLKDQMVCSIEKIIIRLMINDVGGADLHFINSPPHQWKLLG